MKTFLKGMAVGATMLIPGVSGGTMAMILGIYDRLVQATASWSGNRKENTRLLGLFACGGIIGILLLAKPLLYALERWTYPMCYLFLGAVAGGIPMILRKAGTKRIKPRAFLYLLFGMALIAVLAEIPGLDVWMDRGRLGQTLYLFGAGILAAAALILPGISISYLLLLLGLYDHLIDAVVRLEFGIIIPMGVGGLLGVLLFTKLLEQALERYPMGTYFWILGFMAGSLPEIYPGLPPGKMRLICLLFFCLGFCGIYWSSHVSEDVSSKGSRPVKSK